jgi:hypothetical protein
MDMVVFVADAPAGSGGSLFLPVSQILAHFRGVCKPDGGECVIIMKGSDRSGRRVKAAKCHYEVSYDNRNEKSARVLICIQI